MAAVYSIVHREDHAVVTRRPFYMEVVLMGLMKSKKKKEELPPPLPVMEHELVMHNTTTLTADEEGEFCHALLQTDKPLTPAEWQMLADKARNGARFVLQVIEGPQEDDKESK